MTKHATDAIHLVLMLAALGLTYLVPFELLLLSYVVLGPAHYFTEISWLHDRKYFLPHRSVPIVLAIIAVIAALIDNASWFGLVMWLAFVVCALLAAATTALQATALAILAIWVTAVMAMNGLSLAVLGILLPTLVHVSLFTLVFMVLGAIRSGSRTQALLVMAYVAAIVLLLAAPPSASTQIPAFAKVGHEYFGNVAPALGRLLGIADLKLDTGLTSLLAFVYSYHYLNWFIKAEVIRWTDISRARLTLIVAASTFSTALYFYDYTFGFTVLLALSLVHVVLEFPLNSLALRQLGTAIGQNVAQRARRRA
jgi:hypothetical protein